MNKIIATAIAACGIIAAVPAPLTAGAATSVFSGQGAFVSAIGYDINTNLSIQVNAFESATKNKSVKASSSGAIAYGNFSDGMYDYFFNADTTTGIQFEASGKIPDQVTASGSIPGTWTPCDLVACYPDIPDTLVFNVKADAMISQAFSEWGTRHLISPPYKVNIHFDYSDAPAAFNSSSVSSVFGTVNLTFGSVGRSKSHDTERITN